MAERIQEVKIVVTVETNKATYSETFDDIDEAKEWLERFLEG